MKNIRNIAILVAAFGAVAANAQSFELRGANVVGNTFFVNPGQNFDVEVWYNPGALSATPHNAVYAALGIGSGNTQNNVARNSGQPLNFVSLSDNAAAPGTFALSGLLRAFRNPTSGSNNPFSGSARPWGAYVTALDPQASWSFAGPTKLFTVSLSHNLTVGQSWNGLVVYRSNAGTSTLPGALDSGVGAVGGGGRTFGSDVYRVEAVPEPATMTAIAAGLAALAARRRRKS